MAVITDYKNKINIDLDTVYITGAGYIKYAFKGVARDSAWGFDEPVWSGELTRSKNLVMTNIDSVAFGTVSRVDLNFKYMNVQDFKVLRLLAKQRFVLVDFVNRDTGEWEIGREMSFTENSMKSIYGFGDDYIGLMDVSLKMVATNRDIQGLIDLEYVIEYNNNGGNGSIDSKTVRRSSSVKISNNSEAQMTKSNSHIRQWNTKPDGTGSAYGLGQEITIWNDLKLYAIWESI